MWGRNCQKLHLVSLQKIQKEILFKKPHHIDWLFLFAFFYRHVALLITNSQIFTILLSLFLCKRFYIIGTYNRSTIYRMRVDGLIRRIYSMKN